MKPRFAVGIAVNGNEVRAAFLSLIRGRACIHALESAKLEAPLESERQNSDKPESLNELEKAFDIHEPMAEESEHKDETSERTVSSNNVGLIYSLLDRFQHVKTDLAVNAPLLSVRYDFLDKEALPKDKNWRRLLKDKIDLLGYDEDDTRRIVYENASDGKVLEINYECHPPIVDVLEEVSQFRAGNINVALMDTNELVLVDLIKEIYKLKKDEITALVHIEQDFSRVIFLKGQSIYHITPIIHKGSMSKDVLEVIYSRMIFAQDHHFIPELNKILVAGHSSKLKAKYYFRQKFPSAITGYVNSRKIQSKLRFKDRGMLFSRYAISIALAWKALQKRAHTPKNRNLLPEFIAERQRMPKLATHGYMLLILLAATAFTFTWILSAKRIELNRVQRHVDAMKTQLEDNRALTERVHTVDDQIIDLEKKIKLVENFTAGYNETLQFLNMLNQSTRATGSLWLTKVTKRDSLAEIQGIALRRESIPRLANALGGANLKKVTRSEYLDSKVFTFHFEQNIRKAVESESSDVFSLFTNSKSSSNAHTSGNGSVK